MTRQYNTKTIFNATPLTESPMHIVCTFYNRTIQTLDTELANQCIGCARKDTSTSSLLATCKTAAGNSRGSTLNSGAHNTFTW